MRRHKKEGLLPPTGISDFPSCPRQFLDLAIVAGRRDEGTISLAGLKERVSAKAGPGMGPYMLSFSG